MSALTTKQRTKINAALTIAHSQGHDVAPLQARANQLIAAGTAPNAAYEAVFAPFLKINPDIAGPMQRALALIDASDSNTVARYDQALSTYIRTGDDSTINALEPMMRRDSVALAIRNGEITAEDANAGNVNWDALGFDAPTEASRFEFKSAQASPMLAPADNPQEFGGMYDAPARFSAAFMTGALPRGGGVQIGAGWEKHNATLMPTTSRPSPYAGMTPDQIKVAMAQDFSQRTGWQRDATD